MRVIQNGDLCLTVLGSGKFKIRVTPDLFVYCRLFSVSKTMPFVLPRKEEYCHHLQKVEGQKPLLKGLQLYSQGEYPLWIHYPLKAPITFTLRFQYVSLRGARCSHGLWLARMSSPLTWLLILMVQIVFQCHLREAGPGLLPWTTSAFTLSDISAMAMSTVVISVRNCHASV